MWKGNCQEHGSYVMHSLNLPLIDLLTKLYRLVWTIRLGETKSTNTELQESKRNKKWKENKTNQYILEQNKTSYYLCLVDKVEHANKEGAMSLVNPYCIFVQSLLFFYFFTLFLVNPLLTLELLLLLNPFHLSLVVLFPSTSSSTCTSVSTHSSNIYRLLFTLCK